MLIGDERKKREDRHKAETADLHENQDDDFSEKAPMRICIKKNQPRDTGRACGGESGIQRMRPISLRRGDR